MCFYKINDLRHKMRHFTGKLIKLQTTQEEKVRFILHHWYQGRIDRQWDLSSSYFTHKVKRKEKE